MVTPTALRPALPAVRDSPRWPPTVRRVLAAGLTLAALLVLGAALAPAPAVAVGSASPAASRAVEGEETPLTVRISTLTPASMPRSGPIRVTGTVTNDDDEEWTDVQVFAFVSSTPITSPGELERAVRTPPEQYVGDRITVNDTYDTIEQIAPGQTVRYAIRVPRSELPDAGPGVYWFGVHALGTSSVGRVDGADGRARTFLPLVPDKATPVETAVVLPLRHSVVHAVDGALADVEDWTRALRRKGRLGSLLAVAEAAGSRTVSWLVDPAVLDALAQLAAGNPARSLAPTVEEPGGEDDADSETGGPSDSDEPSPSGSVPPDELDESETGEESEELDPTTAAAADAARSWLDRFRAVVEDDEVLALPYGDIDVAAAAEHDPSLYRAARERSERAMTGWKLDATPAASPAEGYFDLDALLLLESDATVLVSDQMVPGLSAVVTIGGQSLVTTSTGAAAGGPGPDDGRSALALRQRILAEAAVRSGGLGAALVVSYPADGPRGRLASLFAGLDAPFVELTDVVDVNSEPPRPLTNQDLRYPEAQEEREVGPENFAAARALTRVGDSLQNLLLRNDRVGGVIADQALSAVSYAARDDRDAARLALDGSREWVEERLSSIQITAPRGVTLSSSDGRFSVTLSNGLEEPVVVQVEALADAPLEMASPDPVTIAPGGRTSVLLNAHVSRVGVYNVTLLVTDSDGTPLGSTDRLPVRSAQVSGVIWVIIAAGGGLLLGTVAIRLVRRVRAHRRSSRAAGAPEREPEPEQGAAS
ncbi:DUF6049 family protein [Nocardioides ferulae]|uniref:DUF6049 family protein n=1 Tax=Nocardioides ferulae TaxID=2340821 RepID=UPI000EABD4C9|nr:DUF6049 family protein [Nocardioides ferulae]